jgi:TATA element modulatory factor
VDVQSSTAPLLRQLESNNKQNRARAAAWAELETQLRTELEENVILNEKLSKERSELKTTCTRLERSTKEFETELKQLKGDLRDKSEKVQKLEHQLGEMETQGAKMKAEWAEVERLANEGVSRVRSEMTRTVVDAEERHRAQMESLEAQLRQERDQRTQLEQRVQGLLDNAGMFVPAADSSETASSLAAVNEAAPKRLQKSQGQAEILAGALGELGGGGDDEHSDVDDNDDDDDEHAATNGGSGNSFAALEQLTSRLKATKAELITLRSRLAESEKTREELVQVLAESRHAREKLPLFEARVQELTAENRELTLEVEGLREDVADVRELYRTQLNVLLEAQAAAANHHPPPPRAIGGKNENEQPVDAPNEKSHHINEKVAAEEEEETSEATPNTSNGDAALETENSN